MRIAFAGEAETVGEDGVDDTGEGAVALQQQLEVRERPGAVGEGVEALDGDSPLSGDDLDQVVLVALELKAARRIAPLLPDGDLLLIGAEVVPEEALLQPYLGIGAAFEQFMGRLAQDLDLHLPVQIDGDAEGVRVVRCLGGRVDQRGVVQGDEPLRGLAFDRPSHRGRR